MHEQGCCVDKRYGSPRGCVESTCMVLPDGKTCADCGHERRCVGMFGAKPEDEACGFFPRRFHLKEAKVGSEQQCETEQLIEALTPSGETKAAYHGEFSMQVNPDPDGHGTEVFIPWQTIKEIMAAIRERAGTTPSAAEHDWAGESSSSAEWCRVCRRDFRDVGTKPCTGPLAPQRPDKVEEAKEACVNVCRECNGTGIDGKRWIANMVEVRCPGCGGSGDHKRRRPEPARPKVAGAPIQAVEESDAWRDRKEK